MKYLALIICCTFLITAVSCKKEYTCCYKDSTGATLGSGAFGCVTAKMSKSEKETTEDAGADAIALCGSLCDGWTFECE